MKKIPILFEQTYYYPTFFDNSVKACDRKPTYDFTGVLLTKTFIIKQYKNGKRLLSKIEAIDFGGKNKAEMTEDLQRKIKNMKEFPKEAEGDNKYIPLKIKKLYAV